MKVLPMPKLKDFDVILYERTVFHFPVKAKDEDAAHHMALDTYYGWSLADRARYTTTEQGGVELDIEGRPSNDCHPPPPAP
jgi:hypothetical protein